MTPNDGRWLALAAALLLMWFVMLGYVVQLQGDFDHYKTMSELRYHALEDSPYPPADWCQGEIKRLELENGALREQIAILEGEVYFLES